MKKFIILVVLTSLIFNKNVNAGRWGEGELQLTKSMADYFIKFIRGKGNKKPSDFYVTLDGTDGTYWYCGAGNCKEGNPLEDIKDCERKTGKKCGKFAFKRTIRWKNGINPAKFKSSTINSKWSDEKIYAKLTELGFYNNKSSSNITTDSKITKKVTKKYSQSGKRPIALSWEGYANLIAGTVKFDEKDYRGILNIPLPNKDGICDGTYSLQKGGKGTWQIACTNEMGAAGTLKWTKNGGVTGQGRDYNDKKVKFTVSSKS